MDKQQIINMDFTELLAKFPFAGDFFESQGLKAPVTTVKDFVKNLTA